MINPRGSTSGTLDEICRDLHSHHFPPKVFTIVCRDSGWYRIDGDTWLMVESGERWQLYYWLNYDPRPFIRTIVNLRGFKSPEDLKNIRGISWKPGCGPVISTDN